MPSAGAIRNLLVAIAATFAALAASGVYLAFEYRPFDPWLTGRTSTVAVSEYVDDVHRLAAYTFAALAVVLTIAALSARGRRLRSRMFAVGCCTLPLLAVALVATGRRIRWYQLALWAVTVGSDIKGYLRLPGDDIKFVLVGSDVLAWDSFRRLTWIHLAALPTATLGVLALVWFRRPAPAAAESIGEEESAAVP